MNRNNFRPFSSALGKMEGVMLVEPGRHRQQWHVNEERMLRRMMAENTPVRIIGIKLQRTEEAVRTKLRLLGLSNSRPTSNRK